MVRKWRRRIEDFDGWRSRLKMDAHARKVMDYFEGMPYDRDDERDQPYMNWVFSVWFAWQASMSTAIPEPQADSENETYRKYARILEADLKYNQRVGRWKEEFEKAFQDAFLTRYGGFMWVGWHSDIGYGDEGATEEGFLVGKEGTLAETDVAIRANSPWIQRWPGPDICHDKNATELTRAKWVSRRLHLTGEDLRNHPRFREQAVERLIHEYGIEREFQDDTIFTIQEIWDAQRKEIYVLCEDSSGDEFLADTKPWPYDIDLPCVHFWFYRKPDSFYPLCPVDTFLPLVEENNRLRAYNMAIVRGSIPKLLGNPSVLGDDFEVRLRSAAVNNVVLTKDGQPVNGALVPLQTQGSLPQAAQMQQAMVAGDIQMTTTVDQMRMGVQGDPNQTATHTLAQRQAGQTLTQMLRTSYEAFQADVLTKVGRLITSFRQPDDIIPIFDPKLDRIVGSERWPEELVHSKFTLIRVVMGSAAPMSKAAKAERFMRGANNISGFIQAMVMVSAALQQRGIQVEIAECLKYAFRHFEDDVEGLDKMFPSVGGNQDPENEFIVAVQGGRIEVMPTDNQAQHLLQHTIQIQFVRTGRYDSTLEPQRKQLLLQALEQHNNSHRAAIALTDPNSAAFQGAMMKGMNGAAGGGGPGQGGPQIPGGMTPPGQMAAQSVSGMANQGRAMAGQEISANMGRLGGDNAMNMMGALQ